MSGSAPQQRVNSSLQEPPASHAPLGTTAHLLHPGQVRGGRGAGAGARAGSQLCLAAAGAGDHCPHPGPPGTCGAAHGGHRGVKPWAWLSGVWVPGSDPTPHFPHELPHVWALQKA